MTLVAGIDSSTSATKVEISDLATGAIVGPRRCAAYGDPPTSIGAGSGGMVGGVRDLVTAGRLAAIDECVAAGWTTARACAVLGVDRRRVWRWQARRDASEDLCDHRPGGNPIHGLLDWEIRVILDLAEEWGPIDRSHRKLAHRGSYLERVWVAPSTVRRVLAAHDVDLPAPAPRPEPRPRRLWPDRVEYRPRQVWGFDVTHFARCKPAPNCFAVIDLVSRKWIATLLSAEETALRTQVVFLDALEAESLLGLVDERLATGELPAGDQIPILLAVSDNGAPP